MKRLRLIRLIRAFAVTLSGLFGILLVLAFIIRIDEVVEAPGFVESETSYVVRASGEGIIGEVRVQEGSEVRRGDSVAVLSHEPLSTQLDQLNLNLQQLERQREGAEQQLAYLRRVAHPSEAERASIRLDQARLSLRAATVEREAQRIEVDRMTVLLRQGLVSERQSDQAQLRYRLLDAKEEEQKGSVAQLELELNTLRERHAEELQRLSQELTQKKLEIEKTRLEIEHLERKRARWAIDAPADGIVFLGQGQEQLIGRFVQTGDKVAELIDAQAMVFLAIVPESDIRKLQKSQLVNLEINALPYPKFGILKGYVKDLAQQAAPDKTTGAVLYQVKIKLQEVWVEVEEGGRVAKYYLKPGFSGVARIIVKPDVRLITWLREQLFDDTT